MVEPETRDEILRLHGDGVGRNQVARDLRLTTRAVSNVVRAAGLTFDRAEKARAVTEIRKVDLAARRTALAEKLYVLADEWAEQTRRPHLVFNFATRENTYSEHAIPRPTTSDVRNLTQSIGIALPRAEPLSAVDSDPNP